MAIVVNPRALALRKLKASGLTPQDFKALRCKALLGSQVRALDLPAYPALQLPYFDLRGKPTSFYRLRYLVDVPTKNGADPLRYIQLPGTLNEVYLPPLLSSSWAKIATNPDVSLVITEGELKAAAACKAGVPTLGLGGVWCFKSASRQLPLLPIFHEIAWSGRTVYLAYDSDTAVNADVAAAVGALGRELLALGALPRIVQLPVLKGLAKTGLDDLLVAKGAKALPPLLLSSKPYATSAALYELNAEVVYIRDPGLVVQLSTGQRLRPKDFTAHAYANRYYHEEQPTRDGPKLVKKPAAPAWLGWEQRAELRRLTYRPGQERVTGAKHDELNTWPGWGCAPRKGNVDPWRKLLDVLFRDQPASRRYVEQWLAYPLQHPGTKLFTAVVLWGTHTGTGKSMLGYTMKAIYGKNFVEIGDRELADGRNEWAQSKQFVMGDDVTSGEHRKQVADRLKAMITQEQIRVDAKYVPLISLPDCLNYYLNSNHLDTVLIEDKDRRYFIHEVKGPPLTLAWATSYMRWRDAEGGAAALHYHLLHLPLAGFDPHAPAPMTLAKAMMIEAGLSDVGVWVRRVRDDPDALLRLGDAKLSGDLWTNGELLHLFDPEGRTRVSANGLGRELTRAGILHAAQGMPVPTATRGSARLYAVRNGTLWYGASPTRAGEHYDKTRGGLALRRPMPKRKLTRRRVVAKVVKRRRVVKRVRPSVKVHKAPA